MTDFYLGVIVGVMCGFGGGCLMWEWLALRWTTWRFARYAKQLARHIYENDQ